ncbi:hypothetical protein HPB48_009079 [Haemaphysalis longicornis]|uniref:Uncharacterized protein n=1 Tax=Haemaphysalis longicornis TaxID=44386 RepID=A0A9J6FWQ9_HAELO|nr:hypothetical protein HPB48_009079 [Haemaphysalis longicornis]
MSLSEILGVPLGISDADELHRALNEARQVHWMSWMARYDNASLFSFERDRALRDQGGDGLPHPSRVHLRSAPRCSRHNFIEAQVIDKLRKRHPDATVTSERLITDRDGVRVRPDIVLELPYRVHVIDVAVAWDATVGSLEHVNAGKRTKYASLAPVLGPKPVKVSGSLSVRAGSCVLAQGRLPMKLV